MYKMATLDRINRHIQARNSMKLYLGTFTRLHTHQGLDADESVVSDAVTRWIYRLNRELPYAVDWDEQPTAPLETIEMGKATTDMLSRAKATHVKNIQVWLPVEIAAPFELRLLNERVVKVGSSQKLHEWSKAQTPTSMFRDLARLSRRSVDFRLPLIIVSP